MHRITWYTGTYGIMAMSLLYKLDFMVKCVSCYMGLGSNGFRDRHNYCIVVGHYRTYITSSMCHLRSNLVGLLVLWRVTYNGRGMIIVLQVLMDNADLAEKG
jgi:hypothetical protein